MLYTVLVIVDVMLALALVALILLQHGKGADAGAAFGSGSSGTVFGAAGGASVMQKITTWIAVGFFVVTMTLSVVAKDRVSTAVQVSKPSSVVQDVVPVEDQAAADSSIGFIPEADVGSTGPDNLPESVNEIPEIELPEIPAVPETASGSSDAPLIPAE